MKKKADQNNIDELNPYELDKLSKIPAWLIIILLKYWAAAAAVFFMAIGGLDVGVDLTGDGNLAYHLNLSFTIIVLIALGMALISNYAIKQVVFMMHNRRRNTFRYNIINLRGFSAFLLYLVYMFVVSLILYFVTIYLSYKGWVLNTFGTNNGYGIEPFTYGFCFIIVDGVFVSIKDLIVYFYQRIIYKKQMSDNTPIIVGKGA
ncbi:MAG: hypothetical protein IKP77_00500 [Acholeplasmatales bacterium]|nr:hypothetical protein [Acholeplasmatales bacterium]